MAWATWLHQKPKNIEIILALSLSEFMMFSDPSIKNQANRPCPTIENAPSVRRGPLSPHLPHAQCPRRLCKRWWVRWSSSFAESILPRGWWTKESSFLVFRTLWLWLNIAIENGPVEIVGFPIQMVDLSIAMLNYQRVTILRLILRLTSVAEPWWVSTLFGPSHAVAHKNRLLPDDEKKDVEEVMLKKLKADQQQQRLEWWPGNLCLNLPPKP